MNNEKVFPIP